MIRVRAERAGDEEAIAAIVQRAYADVAWSDGREHAMVARLRTTAAFLRELSLLACVDGEAAGHILLTRATIRAAEGATPTLALAPLSVMPAWRGHGVGARLVVEGCARAAALGFASVVVIGIAGFYPRFGFEPLARYPIDLPFAAPPDQSLIRPLHPGALTGVAGVVEYPGVWLDH